MKYTSGSWRDIYSLHKLKLNTPYHATVTYDGSIAYFYLNGLLQNYMVLNGTMGTTGNKTVFALGGNPSGSTISNNWFKGKIYSCAVYDRALNLNEVRNNSIAAKKIRIEGNE